MPPLVQKIVAMVLLSGVAFVWLPRVTSFDPMKFFRSTDEGSADLFLDDSLLDEPSGDSQATAATVSTESIASIVAFLDERTGPTKREFKPKPVTLPERKVPPPAPVAEEEEVQRTAPSSVEVFLTENPLTAVVVGKNRSSASFGSILLSEGEILPGSTATLTRIEAGGVELETPAGTTWIPLPSRGTNPSTAGATGRRGNSPGRQDG